MQSDFALGDCENLCNAQSMRFKDPRDNGQRSNSVRKGVTDARKAAGERTGAGHHQSLSCFVCSGNRMRTCRSKTGRIRFSSGHRRECSRRRQQQGEEAKNQEFPIAFQARFLKFQVRIETNKPSRLCIHKMQYCYTQKKNTPRIAGIPKI